MSNSFKTYYNVIAPLIMKNGVGDGITSSCVMAQAATIDALRKGKTLDRPTDEMECACPVLRRLAIRLNDTNWWDSDEERTEILRPLIPLLLDSKGSPKLTERRGYYVADQSVRVLTPLRLEFIAAHSKIAKLKEDAINGAKKLRELVALTDKASSGAARVLTDTLYRNAYACAGAYADACAYAYADACADAYADADAYAYACAYAYADACAELQKKLYRDSLLQVFRDIAAITESESSTARPYPAE